MPFLLPNNAKPSHENNSRIEALDVTDEELSLEDETYPFLFYTSENGDVRVRVFLAEEIIWMTQNGMADMFDIEANTISYHLKNIF